MASRTFRKQDYPLVVRFINRHVVVTSPDFNFPMPVVKPCDPDKPDLHAIGEAVFFAMLQVGQALKSPDEPPAPTLPRDVIPRLSSWMSLSETCRLLNGMAEHEVRALGDAGMLKCRRTKGGHRKFLREVVEEFRRQLTGLGDAQANEDSPSPAASLTVRFES